MPGKKRVKKDRKSSKHRKPADEQESLPANFTVEQVKGIQDVDPVNGLKIARHIRKKKGKANYRKLAKKYHVSFRDIGRIRKIVTGAASEPARAISLEAQDLEGGGEKSDEILPNSPYEIARYRGLLSKTEAAKWMRGVVNDLLPLSIKYAAEGAHGNPVGAILDGVRKEAKDQGLEEGQEQCASANHKAIFDQGSAQGFEAGKKAGEEYRDTKVVKALRVEFHKKMEEEGWVPARALNLGKDKTWMERHFIRTCPSCHHILTLEVCEGLLEPDFSTSLVRVGVAYRDEGRVDDAVKRLEESVMTIREMVEKDDSWKSLLVTLLEALGTVFRVAGRIDDAVKCEGEVSRIQHELSSTT